MKRLITLAKAACVKLFAGFVNSRLLAELPAADEMIQLRRDQPSDDPRMSDGVSMASVL